MHLRLRLSKRARQRHTPIEGVGRPPTLGERLEAHRLECWLWFWAALCSVGFLFVLVRMGA